MQITQLLEAIMVFSFGLSWPMSIYKSAKSKTTKGKSLFFMAFIWLGYVAGVVWKFIEFSDTGIFKYPSYFYILNLILVSVDICLYFRNLKFDKAKEREN